jgi:hypothetical protein
MQYKSLSPVKENYGNIISKRSSEQNPNHPKNHLKYSD